MSFFDRLRDSAYSTLDIEDHTIDTQGWMDPGFPNIIETILSKRDRTAPLTILEVGSWKGLSATIMADIARRLGFTDIKMICVDTWLGAPEFWTWGILEPSRGGSLRLLNGWPQVFMTFTKNMKKLGYSDIIVPLPLSSVQAAEVLRCHNITADLIYIDAAHEYEPVKQDIRSYWPLLNVGGTMVGDDYHSSWPGVMQAVNEVVYSPTIRGNVWSADKLTL